MEGRHAPARNSFRDDGYDLGIREMLHFGAASDVRSPLAAAAIKSVASCARGAESLLSWGRACFGVLPPRTLSRILRTRHEHGPRPKRQKNWDENVASWAA